jgi:hypothetical protein
MSVSEAKIKRFIEWAEGQGGESVPLTNEYEIARIKHKGGTFVLYVNKKGAMSFSDSAARRAWAAFLEGKGWPMNVRHKRSKTEAKVARLRERDGNACFFCGQQFSLQNPPTLEHLLSIVHGGSNVIANLALACEPCNQEVGSMDVADKMKFRDQKRRSHDQLDRTA